MRAWKLGSVLVMLLGVALLAWTIPVEDEPGALPLALLLGGGASGALALVQPRRARIAEPPGLPTRGRKWRVPIRMRRRPG